MISEDKYVTLLKNVLKINLDNNPDQKESILSSVNENQYIVAGPGSGKTTVLVLKILKQQISTICEYNNYNFVCNIKKFCYTYKELIKLKKEKKK